MKNIVFISHEASRTGAPILLLRLAKKLIQNEKDVSLSFLLINGGDMVGEFSAVAPVSFLFSTNQNFVKRIFDKLLRYFKMNAWTTESGWQECC